MEVIPLDDRIRSTTVLNTAAPSDAPDVTNVYTADDDDYGDADADAPPLDDDIGGAPPAAAGGRRYSNKLLLGLIAGAALLCAMATGGGVAIQRARADASRQCTVGDYVGEDDILNMGGYAKAPKGPKSTKSPTAKSTKSPTAKSTKTSSRRRLTEDKRKKRMLAEQLGQEDVSSSVVNMAKDYLEGWIGKGSDEGGDEGHLRRLKSSKLSSKSPKSDGLAKAAKSDGLAKAAKSDGLAKAAKGRLTEILAQPIDCKCTEAAMDDRPATGAVARPTAPKSPKTTKSPKSQSAGAVTAALAAGGTLKSTKTTTRNTVRRSRGLTGTTTKSSTKSAGAPGMAALRPSPSPPTSKSSKSSKSGGGSGLSQVLLPGSGITIGDLAECMPALGDLIAAATPAPAGGGGGGVKSPKSPPGGVKSPKSPPGGVKSPKSPPTAGAKPPATDNFEPAPRPTTTSSTSSVDTEEVIECEGDDCDDVPDVEVIIPIPAPTQPVPTPGGGGGSENPPPTPPPAPLVIEPIPTPGSGGGGESPSPNCDDDKGWSSVDGEDCGYVAKDPNVLCVTESSASGVSASTACPASCNIECLTNCDDDASWESIDSDSCEDVADDPIGLCGAVDVRGKSAIEACPASCNKECFVNCDDDPLWSSVDGRDCGDVAKDPNVLCGTESSASGVFASTACPASCNLECRTNCDNDASWTSTASKSCEDVADDPIGLCGAVDGDNKSAIEACPASCNKECFVNCDNDPLWVTKNGKTCDDVSADPEKLCKEKDSENVKASIACPAACNIECQDEEIISTTFPTIQSFPDFSTTPNMPIVIPEVDVDATLNFPTAAPKLDTYGPTPQVTIGATVTVGTEDSDKLSPSPSRVDSDKLSPSPSRVFKTPVPTETASLGGTVTVSTETTGPPTLPNREDAAAQNNTLT